MSSVLTLRTVFTAAAAVALLSLAGCGGGGGGSGSGSTTVGTAGGRVIDGYVSGATVYLDLNFNGAQDAGEPSTVSGDSGSYRLELSQAERRCLGFAPVVVDVPVGAMDEEHGEVAEAYQMTFPPPFEAVGDDAAFNISPLTSVVWSAVEKGLQNGASGLTCQAVLDDDARREQLRGILEGAIDDAVAHYNISETQLFADFVANGDSEAKATALDIVKGLKKSFSETVKLRQQHPDALLAWADYHKFDSRDAGEQYPDAWYRQSYVFYEEHSVSHLQKVTDDLSQVVRTIIYGERRSVSLDAFTFSKSVEWESRGGDDSGYSCDIKESVRTAQDGQQYGLTNLINKSAAVFEDCTGASFADEAYMRYASVGYSDGTSDYSTQFMFQRTSTGFPDLNGWLDLEGQLDQLDINEMVISLEGLPYGFNEVGMGGADSWQKRKRYQDGENQVMLYKNSNGEYRRTTTFPDGTHITECSSDGVTWGACS